MLITIYNSAGNPKVELSPNDSSTQAKEVQGDNVLTLSFTHYEHIELDVDDYADFLGERFWLTEKYRPRQNSKKEWVYDLKLYGVESMLKRLLVIKTVDGEDNPVFTLTAPPREHVAMIVNCMNHGMGNITDWKVGQVDGSENIVIDYFGKYCEEALKEIAEKVGAEWWSEDRTVNICKCEHGEPVELGYNKGLLSIDPGTADNVKFYTRLYPVGSSRNIDPEKYGHSRLQLPDGKKYVEINADKYARVDHYEESAFADIYPRRIGEISSVRSEVRTGEDGNPFTIYYFKDNALTFDPNEYMIGGLVLRVSFQEGSELAGLGDEEDGTFFFEVNFDSAAKEFEIITIWPYDNDTQLPGGNLVPKIGDKYILWHLRMPDEYYALAEEEFLEAVNKYNDDHKLDISVYKAPTDHVWIEDNNIELTIGRRIRLESEEYFPESGYRDSRITRITRRVNLPSSMDIEIGDTLSRTSQEKINDSISEVHSYAKSIAESVSLPDIIRTGDKTRPTDNNLYSAKRVLTEFLSKLKDDRSKGKIASDLGFEIGNYLAGVSGGIFGIDADNGDSFAEVARLFVRGKAYFETLTTMESKTLAGKQYITPGGSINCSKVEELKNPNGKVIAYRCYFLSEQDGEKTETKIIAGDQAISEMFNAKTGVTNNKLSNHRYWRLVTSVNNDEYSDDAGNHYGYIDLSAVDCDSDSDIPKEGDVIEQFGNRTDATRQGAMVFSTVDADAPSIKLLTGIGSGTTNAEHYSLDGRDIISQGYDHVKGHAYFNCYGDTYIGAPDGSTYLDFDQDTKTLNARLKLHIGSTIGDKTIDEYFADKAEAAADKYKYLAAALPQDTEITGGVMLSTLVSLGYKDSNDVRHTLAGMNGAYLPSLGGRTIGSWWGGDMLDLFKVDDTRKTLAELIAESGKNNPVAATSLVRLDGSAYFLGGDVQFRSDKTAVFGSGDTAITIADGRVKLGNGILIDIGGEAQGLGNSIASVATLANELSNLFTPYNGTTELTWQEVIDGETYDSIKANHSFWTEYSLAGKGMAATTGSGGGGGGSLFGLYTDTTWVSGPAEDDALSAVLGKSLHARVSVLEGAGYLTGITKAMVEAVLTGDITSHTHSLLSKPADNRSVATTPNDYNGKFFFTGMKRRDALSVPGTGDYVNGFGWRGWADRSGGKAWEVFGDNTDLYVRCGSTTTWEAWRKILTDGNYASTLDDRYVTLTTAQEITAEKTFEAQLKSTAALLFKLPTATNGVYFEPMADGGLRIQAHTDYTWQKRLGTIDWSGGLTMNSFIRNGGTALQFLMADGSVTTKVVASAVANTGWQSNAVDDLKVPTMSFLAYWNGAHTNGGSSNLRYCDRGRFGTMAVANAADYVTVATPQNISGVKTFTGGLHLKMGNDFVNSYNDGFRIHVCGTQQWASLLLCGSDNTGDAGTSPNTWGLFTHEGAFGIGRNGNGIASGTSRLWCDADNTWNISGLLKIGSLNVSSNALVTNLNAELLSGLTCDQVRSSVMRFLGRQPSSTTNVDLDQMTYGMARNYWAPSKWTNAPSGMGYGAAITFSQYQYDNLYGQLAWDVKHYTSGITRFLYWRAYATSSDGTNKWGDWHQIAFTDSNVASATNADMLDGFHKTDIYGEKSVSDLNNVISDNGIATNYFAYAQAASMANKPIDGGDARGTITFGLYYALQLSWNYLGDNIFMRTRSGSTWRPWHRLAYTTDNVASASKLYNDSAFTAWGQTYFQNGVPKSISGELKHVTAIRFDSGNAWVEGAGNSWDLHSVNSFFFYPSASSTVAALAVRSNGNVGRVGVNMFSPAYDFDVTGVIHASGEIFSNKAIGGKGMTSSSDIRQKHIIGDFVMSLDDVLKMPLKRFKWLDGPDKDERIGVIAQEALKIVPQVVYLKPDGFYGVDYGALAHAEAKTAVRELVEQRTIIAKQGRQIKKLEKLVQKLQQKIHA